MKKTYVRPVSTAISIAPREHFLDGSDKLYRVNKLDEGGTETVSDTESEW